MKNLNLNLDDGEQLALVAKALGSPLRIRIMELLDECSMNVLELSERLDVPMSTLSNNIVVLEEAGLVRTERQNASRGQMKLCSRKCDQLYINLSHTRRKGAQSYFQSMPIGHYCDCAVESVCGLLSAHGHIGVMDDPASFYDPDRTDAQLLWFQRGYVEYRFSKRKLMKKRLKCLEVSFEACAEAPNYRLDYPSDISVAINGVPLGTWNCPGDFGGRQGRQSPDWWPLTSTQFGLLKRWRVDEMGAYLDDVPLSDVTINDLKLSEAPYIALRIGIDPDAPHQGGINLFGEKFGDYNQDIILRMDVEE